MQEPQVIGTPSLLRRLAAMFYDAFLVTAVLLATTAIVLGLEMANSSGTHVHGERAMQGIWQWISFLTNLTVMSLFFTYLWVKNGQTLGMQAWRIRIDNTDNKRISWRQAYIRFFAAFLSAGFLGLGYLWVLFSKDKQSWHDKVSGTQTVLLNKREK
ncbi:Uncharacterised protein [BD1-7 clade bacterium]|uniref:RDD domain-containing protein n=1 Tax=BD1-7 clade bacterium TaxID=2029982 RepID=A0A5S9QJE1_9GAMM|nr:Uncharacterised protein [BD1-7 clade bacterium]CAA0117849.1 Uncharacterised protein [BD1-7 clade bacterium]